MKKTTFALGLALLALPLTAGAGGCLPPAMLAPQLDTSLMTRNDVATGLTAFDFDDVCLSQAPAGPDLSPSSCVNTLAAAAERHNILFAQKRALAAFEKTFKEALPKYRRKAQELYAFWKPRTEHFLKELGRPGRFRADETPRQRLAGLEQEINFGALKERYVEYSLKFIVKPDSDEMPQVEACIYHDRVGDGCARMPINEMHVSSLEEFTADYLASLRSSQIVNDNRLAVPSPIPVPIACLLKKEQAPPEAELVGSKQLGGSALAALNSSTPDQPGSSAQQPAN